MIQIEHIIPQQMVFKSIMVLEFRHPFFLKNLGCDPTNETTVLFVPFDAVFGVSEFSEGIDHDTGDDVAEEHRHEDVVEDIEDEAGGVEGGDIVADLLADVEGDDAFGDGLAVLDGDVLGVDGFDVGVEAEDGEDHDEGEAEE